jgi:hypothetical protein
MSGFRNYGLLVGLVVLVGLASPVAAFGAGNIATISKVEGQNWRHGDIEDALLTLTMARALGGKKFNKLMVSRVYFGNWLRDYSQGSVRPPDWRRRVGNDPPAPESWSNPASATSLKHEVVQLGRPALHIAESPFLDCPSGPSWAEFLISQTPFRCVRTLDVSP